MPWSRSLEYTSARVVPECASTFLSRLLLLLKLGLEGTGLLRTQSWPEAMRQTGTAESVSAATQALTTPEIDDAAGWVREGPVRLLQNGEWKRKNGPVACEMCVRLSIYIRRDCEEYGRSPVRGCRENGNSNLSCRARAGTCALRCYHLTLAYITRTFTTGAGSVGYAAPASRLALRAIPVGRPSLRGLRGRGLLVGLTPPNNRTSYRHTSQSYLRDRSRLVSAERKCAHRRFHRRSPASATAFFVTGSSALGNTRRARHVSPRRETSHVGVSPAQIHLQREPGEKSTVVISLVSACLQSTTSASDLGPPSRPSDREQANQAAPEQRTRQPRSNRQESLCSPSPRKVAKAGATAASSEPRQKGPTARTTDW